MPADVQREVSCVVGADYPEPIVDHAEARRRALERYKIGELSRARARRVEPKDVLRRVGVGGEPSTNLDASNSRRR